jgi:hypothetical protein
MKFKQCATRISVVALAFLLGALAVSLYPFKLSDKNVTIDVSDKRYACGECYIRFGISKIYEFDDAESRSESPNRFDGWDVLVLLKGSDSYLSSYQEELFNKNEHCGWPIFRLTGQFKRRLIYALMYDGDHYDGIYFDANSGVAINTEPTCTGIPQETILP